MKSIIAVAFAGLIASVSAQSLSDMPSCALPCLLSGLKTAGCDATDFKCACSSQAYISASKTCIDAACSVADQQRSLAVTGGLCSAAGVPITVPSGSAAVSSPTASSAASSSASSSAPSTTSAAISSAVPSSTHAGNATTHSGNGTSTSPPGQNASPTKDTPGAASRVGALGGIVALGLGLAAVLAL